MLRSAAEKWIGAVTAIIGLFGLAGLLAGKDAFADLSSTGKATAGSAAALALAAAGAAVFNSYRAAYGWPTKVSIENDAQLEEWYRGRRIKLEHAARSLKWGVIYAGASLALLAVVAGCIWFWPASPGRPLVRVTLQTGARFCGTLLDSTKGYPLRIQQQGTVQSVSVGELVSLEVRSSCS